MTTIQQIYSKLCRFAVFTGALQKPLLSHFMEYCAAPAGSDRQLRAYGAFVSEI